MSGSQVSWLPRGSICTTTMGLGPQNHNRDGPKQETCTLKTVARAFVGINGLSGVLIMNLAFQPHRDCINHGTRAQTMHRVTAGARQNAPCLDTDPRRSIYTTIMELGTKRPSLLWFWGPNSIVNSGSAYRPSGNQISAHQKRRSPMVPRALPGD